jgi:hypothetical protein
MVAVGELRGGDDLMPDPTREEMLATLAKQCPYADEFATEAAVYWFASDWHSGQWSDLYAALCSSPYRPGALERECPDDDARDCYEELLFAFS